MTTLFGISNCDTVKKARRWLEQEGIDYHFHDFRKDGLSAKQIKQWLPHTTPELLINKRSTTWKQLDEASKTQLLNFDGDVQASIALLENNSTVIKRPVLVLESGDIAIGFKIDDYHSYFASN